jgi:exopolysaccharide biosynthesis polyprenyl glycosylphosphotransferase
MTAVRDFTPNLPPPAAAEAQKPTHGEGSQTGRTFVRRRLAVRRFLVLADLAGVALAFFAAHAAAGDGLPRLPELLVFAAVLPVWPLLGGAHGLYGRDDARADHSTVDDLAGVFHVVTVGTWVYVLAAWLSGAIDPAPGPIAAFWGLGVVLVSLLRAGGRALARRLWDQRQRALIVGAGRVGQLVGRKLLHHPEYGIQLVGFADHTPGPLPGELADVPILGPPAELGELVELLHVERVVLALPDEPEERTLDAIRGLRPRGVRIDVVPSACEVLGPGVDIHTVEGLPLVALHQPSLSRLALTLKRALDLGVAALALVLLLPALAAIAILIRLESPGPVLFRQPRMGAGDRPFRIVKFRTMVPEAEALKASLRHLNKHEDPRMFKAPEDPRVTRVGRVLRRFSLDELPQLLNVLRGDMSLVGPRPLPLDEDGYVQGWARERLAVKPGITGLWQVLGREDIPFGEMVKLDYLYVTDWSLRGDVKLLLRTLPAVVRRRDAC